ncbi:MAG: hypothetical protein FJ023_00405 [Chloroflexi bacterium]|nr:hypothetical protein [Chloroflexota bacterium]
MKIRRASITCLFIISSILGNMLLATSPKPVSADSESLRWTRINTPGALPDSNDIVSPCEVNRIVIGSDGKTFYAVDIANPNNGNGSRALYKSTNSGASWSDTISRYLYQAMTPAEQANFHVWNVAVAPDDINFVAAIANDSASILPRSVWVSKNGGTEWQNTNCPAASNISAIDISMSYGSRDIAIATRTGAGGGTIWILKAPEYDTWINQGFTGDILSLKFSPNYPGDAIIAIVYTDATGTYLNAGIHDLDNNTTNWTTVYGGSPPEITAGAPGTSPTANQVIGADLELPIDFSGQALSLRRYYISVDDAGATGNGGIYRIDDTMIYQLMSATTTKRISSISCYGTYASGKLLAGEVLGDPCSATVMTWFTDSPTTCPIPCWYPAMKPLTGAAGTDNCTGSGYGNTQVAWSPDGSIAYAGTASSAVLVAGANWPIPYLVGEDLDESAFSITRNNGETWNQLALIDTKISRFTDIAPSPDCSTIYLASVSDNVDCSGFDSVWRSQSSPVDTYWERVLCTPTTDQRCASGQTDLAILRLAGDKADGQVVVWAAVGTQKIMWSPDFGDYWTNIISPRLAVQDIAAEDSSTLYILSPDGLVQKFIFSGTGWVSHAVVPTELDTGYSIATAYIGLTPDNDKGHIVVGGGGVGIYDVAYSTDGGTTFSTITKQLPTRGNTLVVAHSGYNSNGEIFAINTGGMYEWSIYYGGGTWSWPIPERDNWATLWGGQGWPTPTTGLTISRSGNFYFSDAWGSYVRWAWAGAGLDPLVNFGTDPTTRLRICGGLSSGEPITIWLIDQRPYNPPQGGVWRYIDDLAWNGPTPTSPITNATVKYDPVSGRASEINLTWQPSSLSRGYRIQIAKDEDFAILVADIGSAWSGPFYIPPDLDAPALFIPPGGGTVLDANSDNWTVPALEAGHSYYWRVMVQDVATGDAIQSPWSWREIFTVQAGLPTTHPYYGLQLLSPDNGCIHCPVKPASFSWSPFQGTQRYKFVLAKDAAMTDVVVETELPTTSYSYVVTLDYSTAYFWQVMAIEPVPSDWSATFCFQTQPPPAPQPPSYPQRPIPAWAWTIIICGLLVDIYLFVLLLRRLL